MRRDEVVGPMDPSARCLGFLLIASGLTAVALIWWAVGR